ncbi:hypothetical protein SRHO_G00115610 [Serrasalmus rhombeus]
MKFSKAHEESEVQNHGFIASSSPLQVLPDAHGEDVQLKRAISQNLLLRPQERPLAPRSLPVGVSVVWSLCVRAREEVAAPFAPRLAAKAAPARAMPVAVTMGDYGKLLEQSETQELEAPGGIATPQVYSQLLALYLLHNDMNNGRYLWKRIPQAIKAANPELAAIWAVGQRIWQRDFPGIYSAIAAYQWSETILPVMESLRESTRRRAYGLVAQAYTSISAEDFASFVGYSVEEAVKGKIFA